MRSDFSSNIGERPTAILPNIAIHHRLQHTAYSISDIAYSSEQYSTLQPLVDEL